MKESFLPKCQKPGGFIVPNLGNYCLSSGLIHSIARSLKSGGFIGPSLSDYGCLSLGLVLLLVLLDKFPSRLHHLRSLLLGLVQDLLGLVLHSLRSIFYLVLGSVEGTLRSGKVREDKEVTMMTMMTVTMMMLMVMMTITNLLL